MSLVSSLDRTTDGFFVCPEHGDVLWSENARVYDLVLPERVEVIHPLMARPVRGGEVLCFCRRRLTPDIRPKVVLL